MIKKSIITLLLGSVVVYANSLEDAKISGEIRSGTVQIENNLGKRHSTLSLGGSLGIKTAPIGGISLATTFFTTNPLFGKDKEEMFLGSQNRGYSIAGEAYIEANLGKNQIKAGRQIVDTPYIDSDDIGMIPNSYEGYTITNKDLSNTTIFLAKLNRWSGFDAPIKDEFTDMQDSNKAVWVKGVIYEGINNMTLQAWQYKLENNSLNYFEIGYETKQFNLAWQYSTQDNSNKVFGLLAKINFGNLLFTTAYNKVSGEVINGFGGGPFFTSSQDHTIEGTQNQKALLIGAEYVYNKFTMGLTYVDFDKNENETDYILSYDFNDKMSFDLIYSNMYSDGKMTKAFAKYKF